MVGTSACNCSNEMAPTRWSVISFSENSTQVDNGPAGNTASSKIAPTSLS